MDTRSLGGKITGLSNGGSFSAPGTTSGGVEQRHCPLQHDEALIDVLPGASWGKLTAPISSS
jgi:hypothetical protein